MIRQHISEQHNVSVLFTKMVIPYCYKGIMVNEDIATEETIPGIHWYYTPLIKRKTNACDVYCFNHVINWHYTYRNDNMPNRIFIYDSLKSILWTS